MQRARAGLLSKPIIERVIVFDDLLDVDPGLDDSDLVEEVSDEYDLDYEDALEAVSQYNIHLEEESDFDDDEEDEEEDF